MRNEIEQRTHGGDPDQNLEAQRRVLEIDRESEYARLEQEREVEIRRAVQRAELARERAIREQEAEQAQIAAHEADREDAHGAGAQRWPKTRIQPTRRRSSGARSPAAGRWRQPRSRSRE